MVKFKESSIDFHLKKKKKKNRSKMIPVDRMKRAELIAELKKHNLPSKGKVNELRHRLQNYYDAMASNTTKSTISSEKESMSYIDQKIREKEEELRALRAQLERDQQQANIGRNERSSQRETNEQTHSDDEAANERNKQRNTQPNHSSPTNERKKTQYEQMNNADDTIQRMRNSMESLFEELDVADMAAKSVNVQTNSTANFASFSFRDIESALNTFNGRDNYRIEVWIEEFEEYAQVFKWNDLQKLVYAKRMMKDSAKLFLRTKKTTTYSDLKQVLLKEYGQKKSSAEIHKLMQSRKKKSDENLRDYALRMLEIGVSNGIDEQSVIQYVIDGIDDDHSSKVLLYGAKTYDELKIKMEDYEKYKTASKKKDESNKQTSSGKQKSNEKSISKKKSENKENRCFSCGDSSHLLSSCPTKDKGPKCFKCLEFGHKASDNVCQKKENKKEEKSGDSKMMCINTKPKAMKKIQLNGLNMDVLIDTGSDINAVRECVFDKLNIEAKIGIEKKLTGAGDATVKVNRFFEAKMFIDGDLFTTKTYIVKNNDIPVNVVIGNELIFEHKLIIENGKMTLIRVESESERHEKQLMCMAITAIDEKDEVPEPIQKMIENYVPKKQNVNDDSVKLEVHLTDEKPVFEQPRRLPFAHREVVEKQIQEWIKDGIVKQGSSPYACNVVVVKKKDQTNRVCIDYRPINKKTIKDRFPSPTIDDILDCLQGADVFSTLDLKNAYFHIPVAEESQKYLAFTTHSGQYIPLVAPFGCCNSPAAFQRHLNNVFRKLIAEKIMQLYMDDIIVVAKTREEGIENLRRVLECAAEAGLQMKWKKCQFLQTSIEYLGHIIEKNSVKPSPDKTMAVQKFKVPKTVKQTQSFLGLAGYFRKFIEGFAVIAKPLTDLTRKEIPFKFEEKERASFESLKRALCECPVLKIYNQKAETQLYTDASKHGFGGILMQRCADDNEFHPVYYMSEKTTRDEEKCESYLLEALAVVKAIKKFHVYLVGKKFTLITDCDAFKKTMTKKDINAKVARWVMFIQSYDCIVEHRSNPKMRHVDALSRMMAMIVSKEDNLCIKIKNLQRDDNNLKKIATILQQQQQYDDFVLKNGIIFKYQSGRELLAVPEAMESEVIKNAHENGHFGAKKVEECVKQQFYFEKMKEKIQSVINNCVSCILAERKHGRGEGLLHSIDKGDKPLDTYHIDHLGPMVATCKMYTYLFVVIDGFTKMVWIFPTKTTNAKEVVDKMQLLQQHFGNPRRVVIDRGTAFTSNEFQQYCEEEKIERVKITTGMPRGNGQVERINRSIIPVLTKLSLDDPSKWYKHVPSLQRALNSTYQRSIGTTPFKLFTGVPMKQKIDQLLVEAIEHNFIEQFEQEREKEREKAREQIIKTQAENQRNFDSKRKAAQQYGVNDLVAIKRTQFVNGNKLAEHFFGPYRVTQAKPNERYDVKKEGLHSGPNITSSSAEYMKKWSTANK